VALDADALERMAIAGGIVKQVETEVDKVNQPLAGLISSSRLDGVAQHLSFLAINSHCAVE